MNIFFTDTDPGTAAQNLDDKRVVKMVLETTQLLCTALNLNGETTPYKTTHQNHPSSIWARETTANWNWLWLHGMSLAREYTFRYDKTHKCEGILTQLMHLNRDLPEGPVTPFANCAAHKGLGLDYKSIQPVTEAYKQYMSKRWSMDKREPKWTRRFEPTWRVK